MRFIQAIKIEDHIIQRIKTGPIQTLDLMRSIQKERHGVSKQGVYKALRALAQEEVAVVSKGVVFLNMNWVREWGRFIEIVNKQYLAKSFVPAYFMNLEEGDRLVYFFKTLSQLDACWGTHAD